jgi:oligosaccharide repeat unit polymerase
MWKIFFKPEILFLIGTLQALSPYIIWSFYGLNKSYSYTTTYIPVIIWTTGYLSFWFGTKFIKNTELFQSNLLQQVNWNRFNFVLLLTLMLSCICIAQSILLYGGIPLAQYASNTVTVGDINEIQKDATAGQLGFLSSLLFFLNSLILLLIIRDFDSGKKHTLVLFAAAFIEVFGGLMAGKRQSLLITSLFVLCGLSLRYSNPLEAIMTMINIPSNKLIRFSVLAIMASLFVWMMGSMFALRTGNINSDYSGANEIMTYLEFPLINLESQCEIIGFGFTQNNFFYPFNGLLPYGMTQDFLSSTSSLPRYPEPTAGAGFYGALHWGLGINGTIFFSFISGMISKFFYNRSSHNIFYLLAYCQITWTLISAHTYNHFLTLLFIPVPVFVLLLFSKTLDNSQNNLRKNVY